MDLIFNESDHSYTINGKPAPSVTQILNFLDPMFLSDTVMEAAERGTRVHRLCQEYDALGAYQFPLGERYIDGWRLFRAQSGFAPSLIEVGVAHPVMLYAGRIDRIGYIDQDLTLLDIKTGAKRAVHKLQLAAYCEAFRAGMDDKKVRIKKAGCVYLRENGTYTVDWLTDKNALSDFLAALRCHQWCQKNGGRV